MATEFNFAMPPFDALSEAERAKVAAALDVAFHPAGVRMLRPDDRPEHLFIVIKGIVHERAAGDELVNAHGANDAFDAAALLDGKCRHTFQVEEDLICWLLPKQLFLDLARANRRFSGFFTDSLAEKLRAQIDRENTAAMAGFLTARVDDAAVAPPVFAAPDCSLRDAARLLRRERAHTLLVRDDAGGRVGIASRTALGDAVLLRGQAPEDPVGPVAHWEPVTIAADSLLSDAMLLMTKHAIRRLVVTRQGGEIAGVLELTALLGYLANQSHIVSLQIQRAATLPELRAATEAIERMVRNLFANGTKLRVIAALASELDRALLGRLFAMLAPPELAANSCLVVMGSEGRGEQTLRTDQDNALLLRDGADVFAARRVAERFSAALAELGFPPCPGGIMVSNPAWTRTVSDFRDQIHRWISLSDDASLLPLSAFVDAAPVAGDGALLDEVKTYIHWRVRGDDAFLAKFARPTLAFDTPRGLLPSALLALTDLADGLDLKKAGIFPVVHGARSLALEHGLAENGTDARVERLTELGVLDRGFSTDLREAFQFLMSLRLKTMIARDASPPPATGASNGLVDWRALPRGEAHLLKDSLRLVIAFKDLVSHHFRLSMF